MRKLIYIPALHGKGERLTGLAGTLQLFPDEKMGKVDEVIGQLWDSIEKSVQELNIDFSKTKVFVEGLTDPSIFHRKVSQISKEDREELLEILKNTPYERRQEKLVTSLVLKGVTLESIESPQYHREAEDAHNELASHILKIAESQDTSETLFETEKKIGETLKRIDEAQLERENLIVKKINETLKDGETGILILGVFHNRILNRLDEDIEIHFINPHMEEIVKEALLDFPRSWHEKFRTVMREGEIYREPESKE